jgi:hypothetical protein
VTAADLEQRIARDRIVALAVTDWTAVAAEFEEVERHDTMMAGTLLIVRTSAGLAAVEQPQPRERVVRLLGNSTAARGFVDHRMAQYEKMWDGCGCRVRYYE